jgi:phage terminase large subunit-like protein
MADTTERKLAAAMAELARMQRRDSFDPAIPDSKPTKAQREFLSDIGRFKSRVIRGGNRSGKGATPSREISWILNEDHPHWKRPQSWTNEPLLFIIAGQDRKNMEIEIWGGKLRPQLNASDWREVRSGQVLQYCENKKTGDRIIFLTHGDSSEKNRKHMQGYTAHYVWLDEMPSSIALLDEIRQRASKPDAMFVMTFTPKFRSEELKRAVDAIKEPYGKLYRFKKMDNPLYDGRAAEVMADLDGYSDSWKAAVLEGEWFNGDSSVYEWNHQEMVAEPGTDYSPAWRHVISVDPALKSKFGFTMWAEQPSTGKWYLVKGEYIEGIYAPDDMVAEVKKKIDGYNVVRRISDPESAWFIGQASKAQLSFISPNKQGRKAELIKGLQAGLSSGKLRISPWCSEFINEITGCQWANESDKIVNSSSYHLLDCSQYFWDMKPAHDPSAVTQPWEVELRQANEKRKKIEASKQKASYTKGHVKLIREWTPRHSQRLWR